MVRYSGIKISLEDEISEDRAREILQSIREIEGISKASLLKKVRKNVEPDTLYNIGDRVRYRSRGRGYAEGFVAGIRKYAGEIQYFINPTAEVCDSQWQNSEYMELLKKSEQSFQYELSELQKGAAYFVLLKKNHIKEKRERKGNCFYIVTEEMCCNMLVYRGMECETLIFEPYLKTLEYRYIDASDIQAYKQITEK